MNGRRRKCCLCFSFESPSFPLKTDERGWLVCADKDKCQHTQRRNRRKRELVKV